MGSGQARGALNGRRGHDSANSQMEPGSGVSWWAKVSAEGGARFSFWKRHGSDRLVATIRSDETAEAEVLLDDDV